MFSILTGLQGFRAPQAVSLFSFLVWDKQQNRTVILSLGLTVEAGQHSRRPLNRNFLLRSRLASQISVQTGSATGLLQPSVTGVINSPQDHRRLEKQFLFQADICYVFKSPIFVFVFLESFCAVCLPCIFPQQHSWSSPSFPEAGLSQPTNGITMVCYCLQWPRHSLTGIGALSQFSQLSSIWRSPGKREKKVLCFCWGS